MNKRPDYHLNNNGGSLWFISLLGSLTFLIPTQAVTCRSPVVKSHLLLYYWLLLTWTPGAGLPCEE